MRNASLLFALILSVLYSSACAEEITLKPSFFPGWKYSIDGQDYGSVGTFGDGLSELMNEYPEAQAHIRAYGKRKVWSYITGIAGVASMGAIYLQDKPLGWETKYYAYMGAGFTVLLFSFAFTASADGHLKEAVRIYNEGEQALDLNVGFGKSLTSDGNNLQVSLSWRF